MMAHSQISFLLHQTHMCGTVWAGQKQRLRPVCHVEVSRPVLFSVTECSSHSCGMLLFPWKDSAVKCCTLPTLIWLAHAHSVAFILKDKDWWTHRSNWDGITVFSSGLGLDLGRKVEWWPVGRSLVLLVPVLSQNSWLLCPALVWLVPVLPVGSAFIQQLRLVNGLWG